MKKIYTFMQLFMILSPLCIIAQDSDNSTKEKSKYINPDSPVDNMGFRMRMVEEGIVPFNAPIPFKPAENIGSRVKGDPIDQMSTDVCLWNETGVTESENSVFIDPDNAQYILNSNNSEQSGSFFGSNYIISSNAGQTWSGSKQGAGGANSGDPTTAIGRNGRRYVGYITNIDKGQGVAWSDNGTTWTPVTVLTGPGYPDILDKNHMMIDNRISGTYAGYLYDAWTRFETGHVNDTDIEYSRSTNFGVSWSGLTNISNAIAAGSHNQGVNIQTGPAGQVYAVWSVYDDWGPGLYYEDAIGFARSTNGGSSFTAATRIHNNIKGVRSWAFNTAVGKNMRVNSFPVMAVDVSGGSYNGYIYIAWSNVGVPGTNSGTNVSVYCMRSTDGGTTWGTPVRVNQGYSTDGYASFFPWITCDPVTGKLYCIFYDDRKLGTTSTACEVWVAYSENGGLTWSDFRVGDVSFTPAPIAGLADDYFGDYIGITARDNWVYPCWTDNRSGRALTYVSPIHFTNFCIASGGCSEYISNVQIGSINNSSSCEGYQNFTNLSTSIPVNSSSALTITNGTPYGSDQCGVWVDWNNDGDFSDANEQHAVGGTPGTGPYTATIAPPVGTALGSKTMRIRIMYTGTLSPCGNTTYGEVEDYSINVSAMVPNVWDGSFNHYWHNDNNWNLGHIPTSTEEVQVPNVGYQPISVDNYNEACANLTLETGTVLNIYDQTLTVNGILTINGQIGMLQDNAYLNAMSNVVWNSGSTLNVTATNCFINVYGSWNYNSGSNVNPAMGFIDFEGTTDCWIRSYSPTSSFYNMRIYKSGGAIAKFSNVSSADLVVNNLTFINTGSIFQSLSDYNIVMRGNFNYYGTFDFTQSDNTGSVFFDGTSQTINNYSSGSGIFNNVIFSASTSASVASGDLSIAKNVTINQGNFNSGTVNITLGGNWDNTVGASGYTPGTGTVIFHCLAAPGAGQDVSGTNIFNHILQDNTLQNLRFLDNTTITGNMELHYYCWAYDIMNINGLLNLNDAESKFTSQGPIGIVTVNNFDQGGSLVCNGANALLTVNELVDNGLFGKFYVNSAGCIMNITNSGSNQWVDLNGEIHIADGTMNVSGSISDWPFSDNAVIEMSGGVLDFKTCGIVIANNSYTLTNNITGGIIRTAEGFQIARTDFTLTGGSVELYGGTDAPIFTNTGSNFYNLLVNKSGGDEEFNMLTGANYLESGKSSGAVNTENELQSNNGNKRPLTKPTGSKSNTIYTNDLLKINGTTTVEEGTFLVDNFVSTCMNNIVVNSGGKLAIGDFGTLAIETGKSLTVNNGGFLDITGSAVGAATITHNTGYYGLNIESGGTIGGVYGVLEYMNANGVNIKNGALVDVAKPFNNCTFRNGQAAGRLMSIENNQTFYVENAVFPSNTWGGTYNVYKAANQGMVYFVTASGGFAGAAFEWDPNSRIFWINRSLSLKAYLEGPFNGTNMNTTLNGILPTSHPYNVTLPYFGDTPDWYYTGAGNVAAIPNVNIVDWILVDLRDAVSAAAAVPATSIAKFPAFILNNGNIVGLNGSSNLEFTNVVTNNLFVVIYNRNHQSIMSASPVTYAAGAYTYDYTTGATQVYGSAAGHKELSPGKWGMRSGDGNGDGDVLSNDKTQVWGIPTQLGKTGYLPSDFSFDRQTNNKDKNDKWVPNLGTGSHVPN
jgi:hypothetical protein